MNKSKLINILKIIIICIVAASGAFYVLTDNSGFFTSADNILSLKSGFYIFIFNILLLTASLFSDLKKIRFFQQNNVMNILSAVIFIAVPIILICILEGITSCTFSAHSFMYALLVIYIIQCVIFVLCRSLRYSCIICTAAYFFILASNDVVLHSRGIPMLPQDIFSFKTAATVSGNYTLYISARTYCNFIFFTAFTFLMFKLNPQFSAKKYSTLLFGFSSIVIIIGTFTLVNADKKNFIVNNFEANDTLKNNGIFMSFILNYKNMQVAQPIDYNNTTAVEVFAQTKNEETEYLLSNSDEIADKPNIIVIMNESFSDLRVLGKIDTDDEFLKNFDNLKKEGLSGNMIVSVLGGNTANTEFEFLTGLSMAFLPTGSVAYTQYVNKEIPSVASWLSSLGYKTVAFHPFWERCWKRYFIYPLLGFQDFISIEDMSEEPNKADKTAEIKFDVEGKPFGDFEYIRGLLSDGEDYKKIKELFENKEKDEKLFLFNVTIQNHGGYNVYLNEFKNTVKLNNTDEYTDVEQYLTLIQKSDEYLKELTDYFRNIDEPVIILFFGDHQPWLSNSFYNDVQLSNNSLKKKIDKYTVPYLIWSNKPLDKTMERKYISPNFLAPYLLDVAGIEKSDFFTFLSDLNKEYTTLNFFSYRTNDGTFHKLTQDKYTDELKEYRDYQYYTLFEQQNPAATQ